MLVVVDVGRMINQEPEFTFSLEAPLLVSRWAVGWLGGSARWGGSRWAGQVGYGEGGLGGVECVHWPTLHTG